MSIHDEFFFRNASCALNLISTFLLYKKIINSFSIKHIHYFSNWRCLLIIYLILQCNVVTDYHYHLTIAIVVRNPLLDLIKIHLTITIKIDSMWRFMLGYFSYIELVSLMYMIRIMVFNATVNNISVISGRIVLLIAVPGENNQPAASH